MPGVDEYAWKLAGLAEDQYEAYRAEVVSKALDGIPVPKFSQPAPVPPEEQPTLFKQPGRPRSQPVDVQPMSDLGAEVTARFKEMFHQYSNRQERSQQTTLGPSEIGSPCDRRLVMSLMRMPPVNPGGDGWAAFVGTCTHVGLAEMFAWADAGSGRYAVEQRLIFPSPHVPKGTTDLLDRVLLMADDHKVMGKWARNKLKSSGPSPTYRIQLHTYAYGLRLRGEVIEHVGLVAWPRDESSLDDLYVWSEPYDPKVAIDALKRVDRLAESIRPHQEVMLDRAAAAGEDDMTGVNLRIAAATEFDNSDCKYCPHFMPGAKDLKNGGCNGKQ